MSQATRLTTDQRKALFRALVESQDAGQSVAESRKATAEKFQVSEEVVKGIEKEGGEKDWPPL